MNFWQYKETLFLVIKWPKTIVNPECTYDFLFFTEEIFCFAIFDYLKHNIFIKKFQTEKSFPL